MSVFAPSVNPNDTSDQTVTNIAFFPAILVADFRKATRAQDTVTDERVIQAIRNAMIDVNRELNTWRQTKELEGYAALVDVPADDYGGISELSQYYLTSVYAKSKAQLLEYYRDIDTTKPDGNSRANEFENTQDAYLREAREAIRNILGTPHMTVELI